MLPPEPTERGNAKLFLLGAFAVMYRAVLVRGPARVHREGGAGHVAGTPLQPDGARIATGFVTNFFDTLGIGSCATTASIFRFLELASVAAKRCRAVSIQRRRLRHALRASGMM